VEFSRGRGRDPLRAVDGVSLAVEPGETVGLVGESGSGKTTIGRAILGLTPIKDGVVSFSGEDITHASYRRRRLLSKDLQVVFQDPYSSLNPTRTIGQTLSETLRVQGALSRSVLETRVKEMLHRVGLPEDAAKRYPAHFSGGQRQRVAIARALIAQPQLVICDEPTSSLDLSVQAQVLNLLRELQADLGVSYLFITHDLPVVRHLSHRIIVLYRGRIMEQGDASGLYRNPLHPYTQMLLDAAPVPEPAQQRRRRELRLASTNDTSVPILDEACPFAQRCPYSVARCYSSRPPLEPTHTGSLVACHRWRELTTAHADSAPRIEDEGRRGVV
jgi:oligopeptide/dipeptide ABC transporter ATP-binding protein